jgi:hypothetical protein
MQLVNTLDTHLSPMQENSRARRARSCACAINRPGLDITKVLAAWTALPPGRDGGGPRRYHLY